MTGPSPASEPDPPSKSEEPWVPAKEDDPAPGSPVGRMGPVHRGEHPAHSHRYELMVILVPEIDERQVTSKLDNFLKVIVTDGGSIENVDVWGKRRLAYEIQSKTEGIYAVVNFTASIQATQELDRLLRLNEQIMRTKVLRAEDAIVEVAEKEGRAGAKAPAKRTRRPADA